MAYVAVKGGEKAIDSAHRWLAEDRRGDRSVPEVETAQIREQLSLAVDRVMAEGSCYDRDLAALAVKQARGDLPEAIFLLRAYRTTLPRFGASIPVETGAMAVRRRVSAAFKDIPGGQVLGPTFDYTHRLLDFALAADGETPVESALEAEEPQAYPMATVASVFAHEDLLETDVPSQEPTEPFDLTREPMAFPAGRDQRLQALARGDEGFLLSLAYSSQRGWGGTHPLCAEIRLGETAVEFAPDELGFPVEIAEITLTECHMISTGAGGLERPPQFAAGYGLTFGHCERKAMSMAIVDRALRDAEGREANAPVQDEEFVLYHSDNVEASGFVQHLKLPHYVDFQADLQLIRRLRRDYFAREAAMKEAAE
ncbi:MAG: carbon-phosphorus lyase complex subunit PhnI [Phenylobacterium sp.]|uniref:carbon-phosphorus lyase complex subunit PhnI n=1 Tax=Phenylobacterium sp. TaxID=1871053 RepID=UPI00391ABD50